MDISHISVKEVKRENFGEIEGVLVGHAHDPNKNTGCSVVFFKAGAVCGVVVRQGRTKRIYLNLRIPSLTFTPSY